jgi:hypothetical protein
VETIIFFTFQGGKEAAPFYSADVHKLIPLVDKALAAPQVGLGQAVPPQFRSARQESLQRQPDALTTLSLDRLLDATPLNNAASPPLLPLSKTCFNCGRNTRCKRAFRVMIYEYSRNKSSRVTTSLVFRCNPCKIDFYHGLHCLPPTPDDPYRRYVYDMNFKNYDYFPISPRTYVLHDWVQKLDAMFATKPISFHAQAQEFNYGQDIVLPTSVMRSFAKETLVCKVPFLFSFSNTIHCNRADALSLFNSFTLSRMEKAR